METSNLAQAGLGIVVAVVVLLALYRSPQALRLVPGWAALAISLVALYEDLLPPWAALGVVALWLIRDQAPLVVRLALLGIGAGLLGGELAGEGTRLPWVVAISIPAVGWGVSRAARTVEADVAVVLYLLTVLGMWAAVPDTEASIIVVAVVAVFAVEAIRNGGSIRADSWWPLVGISLWAAAWGSVGRPSAVAGALACTGVLIAEPVRSWITSSGAVTVDPLAALTADADERAQRPWVPPTGLLVVLHVISVLIASRVAGTTDRPGVAVAVAAAVLAADVLALELIRRRHAVVVSHQ